MAAIQLTGLAANDPVPGSYIQVSFAQGDASMGNATYSALIIASKSSSGSATADTMIYGPTSSPPLATENDAIALFGAGSPAHRMWRRFVAVNKTTPLYVICPAEATGTAPTGTITITGTATGAGTLRCYIGEDFVDVSVASGDAANTVAQNLANLINAQSWWAVSAPATTTGGVVPLTYKVKNMGGAQGRYGATVSSGIGITVTPTASTKMTGGTANPTYTNALAAILPYRFYYIVAEDPAVLASTSANLAAIQTQIDSQALPLTGVRQRVFAGSVDTSFATNQGVALNSPRCEIIWSPDSDRRPEEIAATAAGVYALEEQGLNPRCNFSGYGLDTQSDLIWNLPSPRNGAAPTRTNMFAALNAGVTPIGVTLTGQTYIVKRVSTKYQTSGLSDYRIRDAHKVTVMDRFADDLQAKLVLNFSGRKIGNDPVQGQRTPGPDVVTPTAIRAAVIQLLRDYEALDLIENVAATIAAMIVQRETVPTTRMGIRVPIDVIDIADQFAAALDQVA